MSDNSTQTGAELATADVKGKSRKVSPVWIIPIIAAVIGGWMVFQKAVEEKAIIQVTFKNAEGIEAGKTVVKLRNIILGKVTEVDFSEDLSKIIVKMEFKGIGYQHFTDKMRFWVVKPRIGIGGVSGLDTLLSGAYIEADPGEGGKPVTEFVGLEVPGQYQLGNPGTKFILKADELGSLERGSPIKFRDISVGEVLGHKLAEDFSHVEVTVFVHAPYDSLVKSHTRFWNLSGLRVDVGAEGFKLDMDSVTTLISGGVGFVTADVKTGTRAKEGDMFRLYRTEKPEIDESLDLEIPVKMYFTSVNGLSIGAPVEYKGLRFGTVNEVGVELGPKNDEILTFAMVNIEPDRLPGKHDVSQLSDEERIKIGHRFFENMVKKGLRGQLTKGSLITGQSLVTLDIFPDVKKEVVRYENGIPIVPTVPETFVGIIEKVNVILDRMEDVPLEDIGSNISKAALSISNLADSLDDGGVMGEQAREVMEELRKAARSLRGMTNYLERHPEALLKGKEAN